MTLLVVESILAFLLWTLCLYIIHRSVHRYGRRYFPVAFKAHVDHHKFINNSDGKALWQWNNLLLFNDTWLSTVDLWITEVIPTVIFCWITGQWWIAIFYYLWAALLQEQIEHNAKFDWYPFITSGKWHLVHHEDDSTNFGLFIPLWDMLFRSYQRHAD